MLYQKPLTKKTIKNKRHGETEKNLKGAKDKARNASVY